jgi:hypothetical protein
MVRDPRWMDVGRHTARDPEEAAASGVSTGITTPGIPHKEGPS